MKKRIQEVRSLESPQSKSKRLEKDKKQHAQKRTNMTPEEKVIAQAKDAHRKRLMRKVNREAKQLTNLVPENKPMEKIPPPESVVNEKEKLCEYELIRLRNIAEREKLFKDLNIGKMKDAVSNCKTTKSKK